jgi:hypothetical protein
MFIFSLNTRVFIYIYIYIYIQIDTQTIDDLLKEVKAVTRKSRYYDTEARTGITKTDCTELTKTQETKNTHEKQRNNTPDLPP